MPLFLYVITKSEPSYHVRHIVNKKGDFSMSNSFFSDRCGCENHGHRDNRRDDRRDRHDDRYDDRRDRRDDRRSYNDNRRW